VRRWWELTRLALDGVRRTPLRVALTSAGVAIATGALVSMVAFALGIQEQVEEPFHKSELLNRMDVMPGKGNESGAENSPSVILNDPALEEIAAIPEVALVYPELHLDKLEVINGKKTVTAAATGLPPEAGRLRFVRDALVAGRFFEDGATQEVILGNRLTKTLGFETPAAAVGQTLTLKIKGLTPKAGTTFRFEDRQLEIRVAGVWNPPGGKPGYRPEGVLLPLALLRELPGVQVESALERLLHGRADEPSGYARVVVRVERPQDLFVVERRLRELGYRTETFLSQFKDIRKGFIIMDLVLTAVGTVALVVAGLGIVNTLLMAVLERYREIGTYKALGASDGDVRLIFLAEAGLVGLLGGFGGLILGRVVSWLIDVVVNGLARNQGIDEPIMFFAFPARLLLGALAFAVVVSLVSGVYPAARAARVDPIRALRAE
jgi:putative ABC transport system permease protein